MSLALVNQHTWIILSSVASLALTYFSTLSHKWHDFWKKGTGQKMCFFYFLYNTETSLILRRIQPDVIINVHKSSCKVHVIMSDFNKTLIFLTDFRIILGYKISRKSVQQERTDGQAGMTKQIFAFCNFANSPKKGGTTRMFGIQYNWPSSFCCKCRVSTTTAGLPHQ